MCDNTQQHIEIWNLVWCLVPLHWSKVVLKIVSPHAPNPRTKSGIAALCTLFILFCLERPVACFPVVYKHFYDFFPLLLPVFTCCKQRPDFEWHHPSYSIPGPCNNSGCASSPGGAWSCTLVKASTYIPAQQRSPLHSAARGPPAALLIRCDSDTASRFGGSIK